MPPLPQKQAIELLAQRATEWEEFASGPNSWRFLLDSLEGGERYRHAVYGYEQYSLRFPVSKQTSQPVYDTGYMGPGDWRWGSRTWQLPRRNLIRHRREYPTPERPDAGTAEFTSTDDEYELRLARTPAPGFVAEAIGIHLGRIYAREVRRDAPDDHPIRDWWADVDGRGSSVDDYMQQTVAPLLSVLGQLDLVFDHPPAPEGEDVVTRADVARLGLGNCVVGYILPENLIWWRPLPNGRYAECLVAEAWDTRSWPAKPVLIRHWSAVDSVLYDADGEAVSVTPHPFGRCPVVRVYDQRKARCANVGQSRYENLAEIQREYYNVDSETVLAVTLQAHPLLQGPEDYMNGDTITVGPGHCLPMRKSTGGEGYAGWQVVNWPSEPAQKLMDRRRELRDEADRAACLTKPAGAHGTTGNTVSQSGASKQMDERSGNDWLIKQSSMLERAEWVMAEHALVVLGDGKLDPKWKDDIALAYPREFDLRSAENLAALSVDIQAIVAAAGDLPETEGHLIKSLVRQSLPGKADEEYAEMDAEIDAFLADKASQREQQKEAGQAGMLALAGAAAPGRNGFGGDGAAAADDTTPNEGD